MEPENIRKAIKAIGDSKLPLSKALIKDVQRVLIKKGYDEAVVFAQQAYLAADLNAELARVLIICRRYNLSPEAAARILEILSR